MGRWTAAALWVLAAAPAVFGAEEWPVAPRVWRSFTRPDPGRLEVNGELNAVEDARGGLYVVWTDSPTGAFQVYGEHLDGRGRRRWGRAGAAPGGRSTGPAIGSAEGPGAPLQITQGSAGAAEVSVVPDGRGGAVVAWLESQTLKARRFDPNGVPLWGEASGSCPGPTLGYIPAPGKDGGALLLDLVRAGDGRIGALPCRLDGAGRRLSQEGAALTLALPEDGKRWLGFPAAVARPDGGAWFLLPSVAPERGGKFQHRALRLRYDGRPAGPAAVFARDAGAGQFAVGLDAGRWAWIAWTEGASGPQVLRAARLSDSGRLEPEPGLLLSRRRAVLEPRIAGDGRGGAWVSWIASAPGQADGDLRVARLEPDGGVAPGFAPEGLRLGATQGVNALVSQRGDLGAFFWSRNGAANAGSVRMQQLSAAGGPTLLGGPRGRPVPVPVEDSRRCFGTRFVQAFPGDRAVLLLCGIRDGLYVLPLRGGIE